METILYPYIFNPLISEEDLEKNECSNGIYVSAAQFRTLHQQDSEDLVILQISHNDMSTYAHVLGVHQEDGEVVYAPSWMITALGGDGSGDFVTIERIHPSLGTKIKIEPQSTEYTEEEDPVAVLTHAFENYSCVAPGQDILLNANGKRIMVNIVSTNSDGPICIRGMELEVEIQSPEAEAEAEAEAKEEPVAQEPASMFGPMFAQPEPDPRFPGVGYRLGNK